MTDAELDAQVVYYRDLTKASRRTQDNHQKHWPRWEKWAVMREIDPLGANPSDVASYVLDDFDGVSRETFRHYLRAIGWHYEQANRIDPTKDRVVLQAVDRAVLESSNRVDRAKSPKARALPADLAEAVLSLPPPAPALSVDLVRCQLAFSWHLKGRFIDRLIGLASTDLRLTADGLLIGSVLVKPTTSASCPVAAWRRLLAAGFLGGAAGLFAGLEPTAPGEWVDRRPADVDKAHLSRARHAVQRYFGRRQVTAGPATPIRSLIPDLSDLDQVLTFLDPSLWRWCMDNATLALQFWGGLRASDACRLRWAHVNLEPVSAALVHLPWQKNDQHHEGHTRALPLLPNSLDLCPAGAMRRWRNLTVHRLGRSDPVIPQLVKGGRDLANVAWDPDTRGGDASASLSRPLKDRLRLLGMPTRGYASHSGRKTLATLAVRGGALLTDVSRHLDHERIASSAKYLDADSFELEDPASAANSMSWETAGDDDW